MKSFYLHTYGCQMNESDSERLGRILQEAGWNRSFEPADSELLIVNTCTVRKLAEDKAFSLLGRWAQYKEANPKVIIGMVGCLAQHLREQVFSRMPWLDFLAGPKAFSHIPEMAEHAETRKHQHQFGRESWEAETPRTWHDSPVSAFVPVMEGCNQGCAYCAVPRARGTEISRPLDSIVKEAGGKLAAGAREITLLGQTINRYGFDLEPPNNSLEDLLRTISGLPGLARLRFLTSHPKYFSDRLIQTFAEIPNLARSLHLPMQSGSNEILMAMNRGYTIEEYEALVTRIRSAVPDFSISTDVIVGFPGETESDFEATLRSFSRIGFCQAYCFKYSTRQGTAAARRPNQVPQPVKEERLKKLLDLVNRKVISEKAAMVGKRVRVLAEKVDNKLGRRLQGRTDENHIVFWEGPETSLGSELKVRIVAAGAWSLIGEAA